MQVAAPWSLVAVLPGHGNILGSEDHLRGVAVELPWLELIMPDALGTCDEDKRRLFAWSAIRQNEMDVLAPIFGPEKRGHVTFAQNCLSIYVCNHCLGEWSVSRVAPMRRKLIS